MAGHLAKKKTINWTKELALPKLPRLLPQRQKHSEFKEYERSFTLRDFVSVLAGVLLLVAGLVVPMPLFLRGVVCCVAVVAACFCIILRVIHTILDGKFPYEDLMLLLGLFLLSVMGHPTAAAISAILIRMGELAEAYVLARRNAAIELLRDSLPEKARVETDHGLVFRAPENVREGEILRVEKDEAIPLDGVIVEGVTELDISVLSGSAASMPAGPGKSVLSGTVNRGAPVRIRVSRSFEESAAVKLLENTQAKISQGTRKEWLAGDAARYFAPAVGGLAVVFGLIVPLFAGNWTLWITRAAILLLLSSPASLAISVPLAYLGAVLSAGRQGILAKGHNSFDTFARVNTMLFGKTGTITEGNYTITEIFPNGVSEDVLLATAAAAESFSTHPIADMLKQVAGWTPEVAEGVMQVEEIPGCGVSAFLEGKHVCVGNAALMERHGVAYEVPSRKGAAIHIAVDGHYWGHIMVADKVRDGAFDALESLRMQGVNNMVLLTGDVRSVARPMASALNFDMVKTQLDPQGKLSAINYLQSGQGERRRLAYVGDGINDAAMLRKADLGIAINAIHAWEEAEAADLIILDGEISRLPLAKRISVVVDRIALENLCVLAALKLVLIVLTLTGTVSAGLAVGLDALGAILAVFNSLRAYALERGRR